MGHFALTSSRTLQTCSTARSPGHNYLSFLGFLRKAHSALMPYTRPGPPCQDQTVQVYMHFLRQRFLIKFCRSWLQHRLRLYLFTRIGRLLFGGPPC